MVVFEFEVDADEFEGDVHLFADFDGALQGKVVCLDCFRVLRVVVVDLCLCQKCVTNLGLTEVLLGVLYLCVFLLQQLLKSFLNVHDLNYF